MNPTLLALVRRLDINIDFNEWSPNSIDRWVEIEPRLLKEESVVHLFHQLVELEELEISGASRIIQLILYQEDPTRLPFPFLSTLKALDLVSTFDFLPSSSDRLFVLRDANLGQFKELTQLSLDVRHDARSAQLEQITTEVSVQFPPNLEDLSLSGNLSSSIWDFPSLPFPEKLTALSLYEIGDTSHLFSRLQHFVKEPQQIKNFQLWLSNDDSDFSQDEDPLQELSKYGNLTSLTVQGPWVPTTSEFYSTIARLPLSHLSFKIDTEVSTTELIKLIATSSSSSSDPTSTNRCLQRITLDNVDAFRGESLPRDQGADAVRDADLIGLGWNLANWTETFSRQGLKELVEVAKREGIAIDGYAVQSLEIEDAWEEEMRYYREVTGSL
ncbi:hypothetical protein JCM3765_003168 [Sporobolomyces pararoseus]